MMQIPDHIGWSVDLLQPVNGLIYPSLLKKINKSDKKFKETVSTLNVTVDIKFFEEEFLPIYIDEIASRKDYHLNLEKEKNKILQNLKNGKEYFCFMAIVENKFVGGTLYSVDDKKASVALRTFERDINRKYKFRTTIDYWMEKNFLLHLKNEKLKTFAHGADFHPRYINIGLPLFKLKIGGRPRLYAHEFRYLDLNVAKLAKDKLPALFFSEENADGFFLKLTIISNGKNINESMVNEYKSICQWANLIFEEIKI